MSHSARRAGLPPGALVYTGKKAPQAVISVMDYDAKGLREKTLKAKDCSRFKGTKTTTWINVAGLSPKALETLGNGFGLHPLVLEDILNTDQRPKLEDYEGYLCVIVKMLAFEEKTQAIVPEQVSVVLGKNYVISFQKTEGDIFDSVRERIRSGKGRIRKSGADYLAYALLDRVVDNYFVILEQLGEEVEDIEEALVKEPHGKTLHQIYAMKRQMITLRKSVWPLREVVSGLERSESLLIQKPTRVFLRDVYDHTVQVIDTVETYRDMASGMLDLYLSSISNRMNAVMKVLTIIATIFIPLTFIAGVYGMNFRYMPELDIWWAYPAVLLVMLAVAGAMIFYFKKKKWL